jgi:plastocyanin
MRLGHLLLGLATLAVARMPDAAPSDGGVTGSVRFVRDGKAISITDGYVYLQPVRNGRRVPPKPKTEKIVQRGERFIPDRIVIPMGSTVAFPNEEPKTKKDNEHNVFSPTDPIFDLDHYGSGKSKSRVFPDADEYDIYCDIHQGMNAKVKVVDSDYITHVVDGTYAFTNIPPGKYKVVVWAPDSDESKETITVVAGETARVPQLNLQVGKPKPHLRKDGTPYPPNLYDKNRK